MQGNGGIQSGWSIVLITILDAEKKGSHGASFLFPVSWQSHKLMAIIYVDGTLSWIWKKECMEEMHLSLNAASLIGDS